MLQDKELEIQFQFLEEAQEYLGTLESTLLGLANGQPASEDVNAALRAAHSIKGGASMMGFHVLSQLAHRLEDSFKVLKTQRSLIEVDGSLEELLLDGVDCLRQVIALDRQGLVRGNHGRISHEWLETQVNPVFDQLHERLGDPQDEDAVSMLSPEDGQDLVPILFQTEVEGCLQRLEAVLADPQLPCLREELEILAQELGGLGEMLQLSAFVSLCGVITQQLAAAPDRVEELAHQALRAWRRSQALILTGQIAILPTNLNGTPGDRADPLVAAAPPADYDRSEMLPEKREQPGLVVPPDNLDLFAGFLVSSSAEPLHHTEDILPAAALSEVSQAPSEELNTITRLRSPSDDRVKTDVKILDVQPDTNPVATEPADATVRVPVRRLNQLDDLFGEFTIERNGLDLHLKHLRELVVSLSSRVQVLEQSNVQLRTAYDRVTTEVAVQPLALLPASTQLESSFHALVRNGSTPSAEGSGDDQGIRSRFDVLEMDRYSSLHLLSQEVMETIVQIQEVTSDIELSLEETDQTARQLNKTSKQLQTSLTQVRMRPLADILERFPRALRDLCLQYGKSVELKIYGGNTLVDRSILETLSDPLMHLLRNAFDHGIEDPDTREACGKPRQGMIEIRAFHRNNRTLIILRDDGQGISLDKIRTRAAHMGLDASLLAAASNEELLSLIFEPGFSTKEQVTPLSGRGVGLDVVRDHLKRSRGEIKVDTQSGMGTTFTLSVPFTLSIARVLLAESNEMLMAVPTDTVEEIVLLQPEQVVSVAGGEVLKLQDTMMPLVRLSPWIKFYCAHPFNELGSPPTINTAAVLVVNQGSQLVGLQIDRCWGEQEATVRRVEGSLSMPSGFHNCIILGDGRVVPLVNVPELLHWITSCERSPTSPHSTPDARNLSGLMPIDTSLSPIPPSALKDTVLIVDDSINVRRFLALTLEKAGYRVEQSKDGQEALERLQGGLSVHAVICDIEMPRLDGYGFLARVKAHPTFNRLPVLMLTSRSGEKHRQLAMHLGATAYFAKPYNEKTLLRTLAEWVRVAPTA